MSADFDQVYARMKRRDAYRARAWRRPDLATVLAGRRPYLLAQGPNVGGIYFLFDGDVLVYVGQSYLISERLFQHRRRYFRRFDSFAYVACPPERIKLAEITYIGEARPRDNFAHNS